jgi:hypothetical protein
MTGDWQNVVALTAAAIAASYLFWRGYASFKRKRASCGACASCPSDAPSGGKVLVNLDLSRDGNSTK